MHGYFIRNVRNYLTCVEFFENRAISVGRLNVRSFERYFIFFFLRNSLGLHYPKSWQPRGVSWIFQLKTFSTSKIDRIQTSYRLLCKKRNPKEYPLKFGFHLQLQRKKRKKRKKSRVYTSFQEKFPGKRGKKRCCGNEGARIRTRSFRQLFLSRLARDYQRAQFPSRGERAPRKSPLPPPRRCRRALAACTRVNVRMSQLNFLVSLFSPVQLACPTATLVAFHLTILSTKLRPAGDAEKAGRKRNGRRGGEGERRDGDGNEESNGLFQPGLRGPCGQESEGTRRSSAKEGEGVILPCVTRITRAALKSTQRTFYRGQS